MRSDPPEGLVDGFKVGHSSIRVTFDTYGHLMPGSEAEVAERLSSYLSLATVEEPRELVA